MLYQEKAMIDSNWTLRFPRTTRCDGHAIYLYRQPLWKRILFACVRLGWVLVPVILAVVVLSGCSDMDSEERGAANLRDAVAQAQGARNE